MSGPAPGFVSHPNHRVELSAPDQSVEVTLSGAVIARTSGAIRLDESRYPARYYIPQADIDMTALTPVDHATHCPFKGDARYWTVSAGGETVENGAWAYDDPFDECAPLKGYIAFYGEKFVQTVTG